MFQTPAPTFKEKNAVQREVTRLLDALAPERVNPRAIRTPEAIQQHRTPNGCILQAETAALSVTWYAEATDQDRVGELQVMVWRGVVSRRGAAAGPPNRKPAELVREDLLNPIENPTDEGVWRSRHGAVYPTTGLAEHCIKMLEEQMRAEAP